MSETDKDALSIAILAARQALDAANRAEITAKAAAEAMDNIANALVALSNTIMNALYDEDDDEEGEIPPKKEPEVVVRHKIPVNPLDIPEDEPVNPEMPELSGEIYPEYRQRLDVMRAAGDPDPLIPVMHVSPLSDLYPHEVSMKVCWCNPTVETQDGAYVVIHNAADGREQFETTENRKKKMN